MIKDKPVEHYRHSVAEGSIMTHVEGSERMHYNNVM